MNQLISEKNINKDKKISVKSFAIFGALAFALLATMIPSYTIANAFEQNAGSGGNGGDGGDGGLTGLNDADGGNGGTGGTGGNGGTGGDGGSNNTGFEFVEPFDALLAETTGISLSGELSADGGDADGGDGGNGGDGGEAEIETGDADGGDAGSGGDGGSAIAICNTLGCI
ncbi:hypothetical protein [Candidatus Nitrosocosmicus sp. T]